MLFRASALACALAISLVHGSCIAPGPNASSTPSAAPSAPSAPAAPAAPSTPSTPSEPSTPSAPSAPSATSAPSAPASGDVTEVYISTKTVVVSNFQTCETSIVKYGPIFTDACRRNQVQVVIQGLVDIRISILTLIAHVNVGLGTWLAVDLNIFANLYVTLLVKIQVLLSIIRTNGHLDPYRSSMIDLTAPLKAMIAIFVQAGINISALISAQVDLNVFVAVGISLGIAVNVGVGLGLGLGLGVGVNVGAGVGIGI